MSKIALSPNPSGTGTLTISAPNTNVDRVLDLPDGSGALYNQSNILGTVSQSGGVPTGSIIESGSNANGEFVKYADGTLICLREFASQSIAANSAGAAISWAFPASFSVAPKGVVATASLDFSATIAPALVIGDTSISHTNAGTRFVARNLDPSTRTIAIRASATGRWF
jgi:hypothetical protein